jgi:hypothetical protein
METTTTTLGGGGGGRAGGFSDPPSPLSPPLSPASAAAAALANARWTPTKEQIAVLEGLYRQGLRTPTAEQIQQITARLREHGHIEGKNVFYWFQNHKARQRQKQKQQSFDYFSKLFRRPPPLPVLHRPLARPFPLAMAPTAMPPPPPPPATTTTAACNAGGGKPNLFSCFKCHVLNLLFGMSCLISFTHGCHAPGIHSFFVVFMRMEVKVLVLSFQFLHFSCMGQ